MPRGGLEEPQEGMFSPGSKCTRCLVTIDDSNFRQGCKVPHPEHLLVDMGRTSSASGKRDWRFRCEACDKTFTKSAADGQSMLEATVTNGAKLCYSRKHHTIKTVTDERRVRNDLLVLYAGANLQREIDSIPAKNRDIKVLVIWSTGGYDDLNKAELTISMPQLETLKLIDVYFTKIKLDARTPNITELYMQNVPDECDFTILLPKLRSFTMNYYGPSEDEWWIHNMLANARELKVFDSYKLLVGPELRLAGNHLESIRLHRAECLESLTLYVPHLRNLSLQATYLARITILDSSPGFETPMTMTPFRVDTVNTCFSQEMKEVLEHHPRVLWDGGDEEDWD